MFGVAECELPKKCLMLKERWEQKHLLDHTMVT